MCISTKMLYRYMYIARVRARMKIRVGAGKSCAGQLSVSRNRRSAILYTSVAPTAFSRRSQASAHLAPRQGWRLAAVLGGTSE